MSSGVHVTGTVDVYMRYPKFSTKEMEHDLNCAEWQNVKNHNMTYIQMLCSTFDVDQQVNMTRKYSRDMCDDGCAEIHHEIKFNSIHPKQFELVKRNGKTLFVLLEMSKKQNYTVLKRNM